ncbi:MAG TPA: hypothetical protein VFP94_08240 [Terriglobales bacterium]|nr:hypothetical protein [Terriglobales bacterium]
MKFLLSVSYEPRPGAAARILSVLHAAGCELERLRCHPAGAAGWARLRLVGEAEPAAWERAVRKLSGQVRVHRVRQRCLTIQEDIHERTL